MITKITLSNFMGIDNTFTIDLLANNKIKRKHNSSIELSGTNILNELCIIGSNGSGKTSILKAISTIQTFINFPFRKNDKSFNKLIDQLQSLPKDLIDSMLKNFNTLSMPEPNVNSTEDTVIELELYIPNDTHDYTISGVYNYKLVYDNNYNLNGIKEESLKYRRKMDSIKETTIFESHNITESEIGTSLLYENNPSFIVNDNINYYKTFGNIIKNKIEVIFQNNYIPEVTEFYLVESFKNNNSLFNSICKIADNKIQKAIIKTIDEEDKLFFINNFGKELSISQLSTGTIKILNLCYKIIDSIKNNKILVVDEIENSLHQSLARFLVMLMNHCYSNSYSQLIFTTHSTYLFDLLENDQIYYINTINNNHFIDSIANAIKNGVMHKDKNIKNALDEELLIRNPDKNTIKDFINKINNII